MKFRIAKEDHEKAIRALATILSSQRSQPTLYAYPRSRSYFIDAEDNPDQEMWMFIDEYDDRKAHGESLQNALKMIPPAQKTTAHLCS